MKSRTAATLRNRLRNRPTEKILCKILNLKTGVITNLQQFIPSPNLGLSPKSPDTYIFLIFPPNSTLLSCATSTLDMYLCVGPKQVSEACPCSVLAASPSSLCASVAFLPTLFQNALNRLNRQSSRVI